jgi:hypothetical protein
MLNFPKDQLLAPSPRKRRATEPPAGDDATDIDSRPAKRAHLQSPGQGQAGAPRITPIEPAVTVHRLAHHTPWPVVPPVASPPLLLPTFHQPYRGEAHLQSTARNIGAAQKRPLTEIMTDTSRLAGSARQSNWRDLQTQALHPAGSTSATTATSTTGRRVRQLQAANTAPRHVQLTPSAKAAHSVSDRRFESLARQVRDAKTVALNDALIAIRAANLDSQQAFANWFNVGAMLCMHFDAQQDKDMLRQCIESLLLRIRPARSKSWGGGIRGMFDAASTIMFSINTPAGFIRILQRARNDTWRNGRLSYLLRRAGMVTRLLHATRQQAAGPHRETSAQEAAAEFLLARNAVQPTPAADASPPAAAIQSQPMQLAQAASRFPADDDRVG